MPTADDSFDYDEEERDDPLPQDVDDDDDDGDADDMVCPSCGRGLWPDTPKCNHCGAWVSPVTPGGRGFSKYTKGIALFLLLSGAIWFLMSLGSLFQFRR